ncbi:MAG TPA: hypothetical protein VFB23_13545 [Candidatus Acidoferrales bacterium]|nr:hypothetical protein [Candidatus Acidoferrales bacterium]
MFSGNRTPWISSVVVSRLFFFTASILGVLSFNGPATAAQAPGLNGFALCTSKQPKQMGYVEGNPVYFSEVFQVHSNEADYDRAFAAFLMQKYNFSGPMVCSVAWAKDDQVREFNRELQAVGSLAVRTGWTLAGAGAAPAPAEQPIAAPKNNAPPQDSTYFVCTWPTSAAGVLTFYVSDVNGVPAGKNAGTFLAELAPAFGNFVTANYHAAGGSYNCVYQFSQADAEALKERDLTTGYKGYTHVDTGWRYGQTAAPASASAATGQPAVAGSATAPAAAAPAPAVPQPAATVTIVMRLVDSINSASDQPGRQYRGVVTQAATAGSVSIPVNTLAKLALAQSGGTWNTQLSFLSLNGQEVAVTSTNVTATSIAQQTAQKLGSVLGGFGGFGKKAATSTAIATAIPEGNHVFLPEGTTLTFTASVPQPSAQALAASTAPPSTSSASPAATGAASAAAPASNAAAVPAPNQALPQTGNGKQAFCFAAAEKNQYVSATFDAKYVNPGDEAPWVLAFSNYVATHFNPKLAGVRCMVYQSAVAAQAGLKNRETSASQPGGLPITETGWVYHGPEPGPAGATVQHPVSH